MRPAEFPEANLTLTAPEGIDEQEVAVLPAHRYRDANGRSVCLSCWELEDAELEEIVRTRRVWLHVWGRTMPPTAVTGFRPELLGEPCEAPEG